jgi:protein-S-isoprenylcysteine O-methyltransferase Ste14
LAERPTTAHSICLESLNSLYLSAVQAKSPLPIPPPFLVLILLLVSACLMAAIPLGPIPIPAARVIGGFFLLIGLITGFSGFSAFRKAGTPLRPGDEPTQFVTYGPFRITRNPMYLGFGLLLMAAFFLTKSAFFLIPPVIFFLLMNFVLVPFEEKLMTENFGESYTEYRRRVRRWL